MDQFTSIFVEFGYNFDVGGSGIHMKATAAGGAARWWWLQVEARCWQWWAAAAAVTVSAVTTGLGMAVAVRRRAGGGGGRRHGRRRLGRSALLRSDSPADSSASLPIASLSEREGFQYYFSDL